MISIFCVGCNEDTKSQENSSSSYAKGNPFIGDKEMYFSGGDITINTFVQFTSGDKIKFTENGCIIKNKSFDIEYRHKDDNLWSLRNKNNNDWFDYEILDKYVLLDNRSKQILIANVKGIKEDAAKHDAIAQYWMGMMYKNGIFNCEKDWDQAMTYFRRSGEQKNAKANYELGMMYLAGGSNQKYDIKRGIETLEYAAELGDLNARSTLAMFYYFGESGVPCGNGKFKTRNIEKDYNKAYKFCKMTVESYKNSKLPENRKQFQIKKWSKFLIAIEGKKSEK